MVIFPFSPAVNTLAVMNWAAAMASVQNDLGSFESNNMVVAMYTRVWFILSERLFCSWV
jgi:hypothetical protein